jgi:hypothetical protein
MKFQSNIFVLCREKFEKLEAKGQTDGRTEVKLMNHIGNTGRVLINLLM